MTTSKTINLDLGDLGAADVITIRLTLSSGNAAAAEPAEIKEMLRRLKTYANRDAVQIVYDELGGAGYTPHVANSADPEKRPAYLRWAGLGFQNTRSLGINAGAAAGHVPALLEVPGSYERNGTVFLPIKTLEQARAAVAAVRALSAG